MGVGLGIFTAVHFGDKYNAPIILPYNEKVVASNEAIFKNACISQKNDNLRSNYKYDIKVFDALSKHRTLQSRIFDGSNVPVAPVRPPYEDLLIVDYVAPLDTAKLTLISSYGLGQLNSKLSAVAELKLEYSMGKPKVSSKG